MKLIESIKKSLVSSETKAEKRRQENLKEYYNTPRYSIAELHNKSYGRPLPPKITTTPARKYTIQKGKGQESGCFDDYIKQKQYNGVCYPVVNAAECSNYSWYKWDNKLEGCFDNTLQGKYRMMKAKKDFEKENPDKNFEQELKTMLYNKRREFFEKKRSEHNMLIEKSNQEDVSPSIHNSPTIIQTGAGRRKYTVKPVIHSKKINKTKVKKSKTRKITTKKSKK
jgi:hypothetical protein